MKWSGSTSIALALTLAAACGARSGVWSPPPPDAGPFDAGRVDASRADAGRSPDGARLDAGRVDAGRIDAARDTGLDARPADAGADAACERGDRDLDLDGFGVCDGDCDDRNPSINPARDEVCDGLDNDCDGRLDEGVLSECGDCRPGCHRVRVPGMSGWDTSDSAGVELDPDGALTLSTTRTETHFAWIANYLFGTVTRLDTRTGQQVGEYDSVLIDGTNHARPPNERCGGEVFGGGNCPSRTAVDLRGGVYVANRAFHNQGTITKIAGDLSDCIDRDGDGAVETSRDIDGDGLIEREVAGELLGQNDECILWTVDVGDDDGVPRALAVDSAGTVWVGLHHRSRAVQLDPTDGRVLRTVRLGIQPYGAAADSLGRVWFTEVWSGSVVAVDAASGEIVQRANAYSAADRCAGSYGITIDRHDRVWLAGFTCPAAFRLDPGAREFVAFSLPDSGATRGIAVDSTDRVYVATSHAWIRVLGPGLVEASAPESRLTIFDGNDGSDLRVLRARDGLPGLGSIGVGLDSEGVVWMVNQDSSTATQIDVRTGAIREVPTGLGPYTYSDFTGYALRTFTSPTGYLRTTIEGCGAGPTEWERVDWRADAPPGTRVELRVRTAPSIDELASRTWFGPFTDRPTDLALPPGPIGSGRALGLELQLGAGGDLAPRIRDLVVQYNCP